MMRRIRLNLECGGYEIHIGAGLLAEVGRKLTTFGFDNKVVVITNSIVNGLYGAGLTESLRKQGFDVVTLEVPDGEEQKSLKVAGHLYNGLSQFRAERITPVLALGGGVIGDLAGFVAATYMRGISLVHLPTTLLAQVDSSIGGKVAVNHGRLKNMIGSFYQPKIVIADVSIIKTLKENELNNGIAEVVKYGMIKDRELFALLENGVNQLKSFDLEMLEEVVYRCAKIKSEIVEKDEKDLGLRNMLNFGHTAGHAIEAVSDFKIPHGQAVALGMLVASQISVRLDYFSAGELSRLGNLVRKADLPSKLPGLNAQKLMSAIAHDKKVAGGKIRFVLPRRIGEVFVTDEVDSHLIEKVIKELS